MLQTIILAIVFVTVNASCHSNTDQINGLSDKETRKEIMDSIASDSVMSVEMIGTMMNGKNGTRMLEHQIAIMGNHNSMMNMMKDNSVLRQNMMSAMIETAKGDTSLMAGMIRSMMGNQQMRVMMHKMTDYKVMNNMGRMNHQ